MSNNKTKAIQRHWVLLTNKEAFQSGKPPLFVSTIPDDPNETRSPVSASWFPDQKTASHEIKSKSNGKFGHIYKKAVPYELVMGLRCGE